MSPKTAKIIPAVVLALCVFFLGFWYSNGTRLGGSSLRTPVAEDTAATGQPGSGQAGTTAGGTATPGAATPGAVTGTATQAGNPADVPSIPGSWPCFRGSKLDNISKESTPLADSWKPGQPSVYWSLDLGEGHAAAAVFNSRVYVMDYDQAKKADALRCLSLADGKELWRYSYPVVIKRNHGMSRTIPIVTDKYVIAIGPMCQVYCCDPLTGQLKWSLDLVKQFGTEVPQWYAGQCPIIDGDKVILAPGGSKAMMIAVECATGKVVWQTPNPMGWKMTHVSIAPMNIAGKKTYVYCASGGVVGVSADNGSILWQTPEWKVSIATVPTPVVIDDRIFLCGGYNSGAMMLKIKNQGGKLVPQVLYRLKPSVFGSDQQTPILYKGNIYGVIPGGQMVCLDLNGKQVWNSGNTRFGIGPYVIADNKIYAMDDNGLLRMMRATSSGYQQLGQAKILAGHDSWGPMAVTGGRLIARDLTKMVCLDVSKH